MSAPSDSIHAKVSCQAWVCAFVIASRVAGSPRPHRTEMLLDGVNTRSYPATALRGC